MSEVEGAATPVVPRKRGFVRRHPVFFVFAAMLAVLIVAVAGFVGYVSMQLGEVSKFDADLDRPGRPARVEGKSVNILVAGVDDGQGTDLREMLESGDWQPGTFRSDTIMVLHLTADRSQAQIVSIPRDSYVPVEGLGKTKINAAFSMGGPELMAKTVENYAGIYLDHIMVVDLEGFRGITDTVGGVDVYVPTTVYDTERGGKEWTQGNHHLDGEDALSYVRQRYGLPGGDFDRIQRQQNFLRALLKKTASAGTLANPLKVSGLVGDLSDLIVVDSKLTSGKMRSLALGSRNLRARDFRFATVPYTGTPTIDGQSVVTLDDAETRAMFRALAKDSFEAYLGDHDINELPGEGDVD